MEQLTTFIINLSRRTERKAAVLKEFENRKEFDVHVFDAYEEKEALGGYGGTDSNYIRKWEYPLR